MAWLLLVLAGILEVGWVIGIKFGLMYPWRGILVLAMILSIGSISLLALAMNVEQGGEKVIPMGTAYAAWTGIGTIGVAILGMIFFKESPHPLRLACMALILLGIIGLKFSVGAGPTTP